MPRLDDLPPDLRATLSLLVDRGKTYAQVAELLGIPESAVRDRAHAALDALAGAPGEAGEPSTSPAQRAGSDASGPSSGLAVSRRGGAALLAGIVVVVVVVVVLLTSGGGSHNTSTGTSASATTSTPAHTTPGSTTSTKSSSSKPTVTNQITLTSPDPASKSIGLVEVLAEGSQRAFYMAAEHLPPSTGFTYVIWLYDSPSSAEAISKAPTVGSNGRLQGGALLPSNAGDYSHIILTRETSERPAHPGPTVLSGAFSLGH
jgi:Sigma-70, region 4